MVGQTSPGESQTRNNALCDWKENSKGCTEQDVQIPANPFQCFQLSAFLEFLMESGCF